MTRGRATPADLALSAQGGLVLRARVAPSISDRLVGISCSHCPRRSPIPARSSAGRQGLARDRRESRVGRSTEIALASKPVVRELVRDDRQESLAWLGPAFGAAPGSGSERRRLGLIPAIWQMDPRGYGHQISPVPASTVPCSAEAFQRYALSSTYRAILRRSLNRSSLPPPDARRPPECVARGDAFVGAFSPLIHVKPH